jgi:YNFM family putative membrane transporter
LPQVANDFAVTTGTAAQIITAYSATYGLLQLVWGLAGDRFGKTRVIVLGAILSLATTLYCAGATSLHDLVLARLLAGAAAAGIVPLAIAWIGDAIPYERRQVVIARFLMGQISGLIFGIAFGGVIGEAFGWRSAFAMISAAYVVAAAGLAYHFRGASLAPRPQGASTRPVAQMFGLLGRPWPRVVLTMTFLEGVLCFGALAYVTSALHLRFGLGFAAAGLSLSAFGLGGLLYAFAAPGIVARIGETGCVRASSVLFVVAFLMFAAMNAAWIAIPASFCAGLGYYLLHNVLQVNSTQMAPDARGAAMSLFATAFFVGQALGVALASLVVDRFGPPPVFLATAVLLPVCALVFAGRLRRKELAPTPSDV